MVEREAATNILPLVLDAIQIGGLYAERVRANVLITRDVLLALKGMGVGNVEGKISTTALKKRAIGDSNRPHLQ